MSNSESVEPVKKKVRKSNVKDENLASNKNEEYKILRNNVYTLLYYSNKPFITSELILQFKGSKKSILEKILEDLSEKNLVTIKLNGKTKVYYLEQSSLKYSESEDKSSSQNENEDIKNDLNSSISTSKEVNNSLKVNKSKKQTISALKKENEVVVADLTEIKQKYSDLMKIKDQLDNELGNEELAVEIEKYKNFISENEDLIDCEVIDEKKFNSKKDQLFKYKKINTNRKKIYKNIIETVSEGLSMKTKDLLEELGIEE